MTAAEGKPVVLVVEDDDQTALFIRHFLESDGYAVRQAASGKAAAVLIAQMPPPALITLDIDLPDTRGDELMMQFKTTPGWDRVPVMMVTATPKSAETPWALRTGAKAYLVKPFKPAELLEAARKLIAKAVAGH
jgi:DNA-binding response OmpR family regulator